MISVDTKKTIEGFKSIVVKFDGGVMVNSDEWIREPDVRQSDGEYSLARRPDRKTSVRRFTVEVWFKIRTGSPTALGLLRVRQLTPSGTTTCQDVELYLGDYATK